jgi:hypothetical protein
MKDIQIPEKSILEDSPGSGPHIIAPRERRLSSGVSNDDASMVAPVHHGFDLLLVAVIT